LGEARRRRLELLSKIFEDHFATPTAIDQASEYNWAIGIEVFEEGLAQLPRSGLRDIRADA
jgi:hypothetical protein